MFKDCAVDALIHLVFPPPHTPAFPHRMFLSCLVSSDPEVKVPIPIHPHLKDHDRVVPSHPGSLEIDMQTDQDDYTVVVIGYPSSQCRFSTHSADLKDIVASSLRDSVSIARTSTQHHQALGCHFCPTGDVLSRSAIPELLSSAPHNSAMLSLS